MMPLDDALRRAMADRLQAFDVRPLGGGRPCAVAVTVTADAAGEACFIITRRAAKLRAHAGQWALPGGGIDDGETAEAAALRELNEELGVSLPTSAALGRLDDYLSRSGYRITPVIVWGGVLEWSIANAEVASAHRVPLSTLEGDDVPRFITIPESERPVIQIPLFGRFLHAPTAAILYQFREVALHGRPTRVAHFEQPVFAWK
jgi:8-oxo-dGTP pyrophosphatase MutT (NUDIX family)